ncbi:MULTISPECIES: carboxypeptidase regulatory-like domain-containing protein [unclassified Mucilaginibacter]|uniref:carboxypeptidase regulatory-like domain-containing protein n=1 Tax=unclassified Mucilaginibacter TaxID=2617802 RepID=UPI002AC99CDA|nr:MULTISPECIES: carboxypeptidase regulatory-like domain-containing protein [unclassified Mucilaginibacter]MEB0263590.1 carboxypeptidase regulatory-like domain-containing protein [Mucilaginibacter sp. 10I4]MEB0280752.1 carboxypeptidase regulatory-like domain-containing protein [Mucilaginibacter sp. 10B2]MEB0301469.1 carboxypeptidase regulatory-like domain-containing protein [Mucilaginibacter sp. 5C4]WPX22659.1 carboxypeptidase regulatory-like domain-containing protein [Mucilaginibacter sp. 5C4]
MSLKKLALTTLLSTCLIAPAFAQRDTVALSTIITKTANYITNFPIEKVYLHLDKPYYAAGDTIWFKAYVSLDKHQPSNLSNIVYIDIAGQDSIMKLVKLPVVNGVAHGNIILSPDTYKQGNYHLRAYTNWMRNFETDYYYNKTIAIGNAIQTQVNTSIVFNRTAGQPKVSATITYTQPGEVLANKKVNWSITNPTGDELSKGKGTTNANGVLNVVLTETAAASLKTATLTTNLELPGKKETLNKFPLTAAAADRDVQFFPEGGELTLGVRSKIAFKAIGANGLGVNIKGTITDNAGAVIANLESAHMGMGIFALMPEDGKTYKANVTFGDGVTTTYDMPRIKPAGITLSVYNTDADNINIKLSANDPYFKANQGKIYYVAAQNGGAIYFAAQTALETLTYSAAIPKNKFPTGLIQLTLFSERGIALAERIVFIKRNDALNLIMAPDRKAFSVRQKVKFAVSAKNNAIPAEGEFSVAVIDETKVPVDEDSETTIMSNLLLTSDIKGYIEKPNYYFVSKDPNVDANLDILMLTQGYRRISYRNIITGKFPQIILTPEQQGLEVSGILRNNTGMPISKGNLRIQIPAKNYFAETVADMSGNFRFSKLTFPDSAQVIISARNNPNSRSMMISVTGDSYQPATKNTNALDEVTNIDSTYKNLMLNSKRQYDNLHILKEVVIKSTSLVKKATHSDYGTLSALPMMADQQLTGERFKDCPNLYVCLPTMLLGVSAENNALYFTKNISNQNKLPLQVFLNGSPVDYQTLNGYRGNDVETIEVFKSDGLSNINKNYMSDGIISIITRKIKTDKITFAQLQEMLPKGNLLSYNAQGYSIPREFYSPKYDPLKSGTFGGDLRSTIFWSPKIKTDKTGLTSFEYFNSDSKGSYRAVIEGMDSEGNLGRYIFRYTVK